MGKSATAALVAACKEALEADNVFKAEGTAARRKIRDAVAVVEERDKAVSPSGLGRMASPPKQSGSGAGGSSPGPGKQ